MNDSPRSPASPPADAPEPSRHVQRFNHDEDAPAYDADVADETHPVRAGYDELLRWVARRAEVEPCHDVLELGSGTGNLTRLLPVARSIVCVDVSTEMTAIARSKIGTRSAVSWRRDDVLAACRSAADASFDRIVSTYTLHHLEPDERDELHGQARRILRPGGRLVVGDLMFESAADRVAILRRYRDQGLEELAGEIEDEFFWQLDADRASLVRHGFDVEARRFSELSHGLVATLDHRPHAPEAP